MSIRQRLSSLFGGSESKKEEKAEMKMSPKAYAKGEKMEKKSTSAAKKPANSAKKAVNTAARASSKSKKAGKSGY